MLSGRLFYRSGAATGFRFLFLQVICRSYWLLTNTKVKYTYKENVQKQFLNSSLYSDKSVYFNFIYTGSFLGEHEMQL